MKLVVKASPLILLVAASRVELLHDLADEVVIPAAVLEELDAGAPHDAAARTVRRIDWLRLHDGPPIDPSIGVGPRGRGIRRPQLGQAPGRIHMRAA